MTFTPIIPSSYQEDRVELIEAIQALYELRALLGQGAPQR